MASEAQKAIWRANYLKRREKILAKAKTPEFRAKRMAYYQSRKEHFRAKHREYFKKYAAKNRDKERARAKAWRLANPERFRERMRRNYLKRKAAKEAATCTTL